MSNVYSVSRRATIIRWLARVWILLVTVLTLMIIVTPDPYATEPVPAVDWFLLSLWGLAIFWLWVAWWRERLGAMMAIVTMAVRELLWLLLKGEWLPGFLLAWLLFVTPAVLLLLAGRMELKDSGSTGADSAGRGL